LPPSDFERENAGRLIGATVIAYGPEFQFKMKLPAAAEKVELDPDLWMLSKDTSTLQ
jgi:hypothetical protein